MDLCHMIYSVNYSRMISFVLELLIFTCVTKLPYKSLLYFKDVKTNNLLLVIPELFIKELLTYIHLSYGHLPIRQLESVFLKSYYRPKIHSIAHKIIHSQLLIMCSRKTPD